MAAIGDIAVSCSAPSPLLSRVPLSATGEEVIGPLDAKGREAQSDKLWGGSFRKIYGVGRYQMGLVPNPRR